MKNFRCYNLARTQYQEAQKLRLPYYMKDQLNRATLSVCLNLAEGSGKTSVKDRKRFYEIALASHRESQALFELARAKELIGIADKLGGGLWKLISVLKAEAGGSASSVFRTRKKL